MVHECDGGKKEVSKDGWSARFFNKIGQSVSHFTSLDSFSLPSSTSERAERAERVCRGQEQRNETVLIP